jgi:hypothetical protein
MRDISPNKNNIKDLDKKNKYFSKTNNL